MKRTRKPAAAPGTAREARDRRMEGPRAGLEGLPAEYAVTSESGLNLRDAPGMDGAVLAELPRGAGVYSYGEAQDGWLRVRTGRLEGWMLAKHLEELPLPELSAYGPD